MKSTLILSIPAAGMYPGFPLSEVAQNIITCMAPSKTFNLAGLATSFVVIPNKYLRDRFANTLDNVAIDPSFLGIAALEAAYRHGEWSGWKSFWFTWRAIGII